MAETKPELLEIEKAWLNILQRDLDDAVALRMVVAADGETYPAVVDSQSNEVLALLCMPPRALEPARVMN